MRIVAGSARGMRLKGPGSLPVRPMADRVRQSLYDVLGASVAGCCVLDAFAGCGALGLEALSRGASGCVFIEREPPCAAIIAENAAHVRMADRVTILCADVFGALGRLRGGGWRFGLVFLDPPFELLSSPEGWRRILDFVLALAAEKLLDDDALAVVQHRIKEGPPELPAGLRLADRRRYGERALSFFALAAPERNHGAGD